jgi:hypothetical protein
MEKPGGAGGAPQHWTLGAIGTGFDQPTRGDPKVARMAGQRKGGVRSFPTFGVLPAYCFNALFQRQGRPLRTRGRDVSSGLFALQLTLEGFDLFRQRDVLGDQCLDFAHGMQNRGVIASAEPAADFRQ